MTALIVDDSIVMRMIVEQALRHAGLGIDTVIKASDGREGLAVLEQAAATGISIDLILSDVHMPVMDGFNFLVERRRRDLAPGVPVIMVTADVADPQLLQAIAAGAQGYISKPFTFEQLQTTIGPLMLASA